MTHKIILAAILILSGNQIFSQDSIRGRIIDYETNQAILAATVKDGNNFRNGMISDRDGNFKIKVEGNKKNLEIYFVGYYPIKFINITKGDKTIDLKEIKLVPDHRHEQYEQDKRLRIDVLENYRIEILGKKLKPYFEWQFLVFDFENNETFSQDSIKGRIIIDDEALPGATIFDIQDTRFGLHMAISDRYGNFKLEVKGDKRDLEIQFVGCYRIRIINIPKSDKIIDLKDVKMVLNHLDGQLAVGGPSDKNLRMKVLENYRINILGKNLKPYFDDNLSSTIGYLIFDFDKNENE